MAGFAIPALRSWIYQCAEAAYRGEYKCEKVRSEIARSYMQMRTLLMGKTPKIRGWHPTRRYKKALPLREGWRLNRASFKAAISPGKIAATDTTQIEGALGYAHGSSPGKGSGGMPASLPESRLEHWVREMKKPRGSGAGSISLFWEV